MNVAAHALILASQRRPVELRRESNVATRSNAALKQLRDAQGIASGRRGADEPKSRVPNVERRTPRRAPVEEPSSRPRRDADERGRLLDVYC